MKDKLHEIFMDKLVRIFSPEEQMERREGSWGRAGISSGQMEILKTWEDCLLEGQGEISQKWEDYLSDIGINTQNWAEAVHQSKKDDIVVRNPCESDKPYMLVPKDFALKILVLGRLP